MLRTCRRELFSGVLDLLHQGDCRSAGKERREWGGGEGRVFVLMAAGLWTYIGAWVAFKTAAQYRHWGESRSMFNRFLAGNALVLILSFLILAPRIRNDKMRTRA